MLRICCWSLALVAVLPLPVSADTLVLRNGSRVNGTLVSVRNGIVEFEEHRGGGRGRRIRVERAEVLRIELDTEASDRPGRPAGLRERQVNVAANVPWHDTGIDVRAGQTIYVEATGTVRWGRDRRDGPGGESRSPHNPNRPLPNRPAAALIGRIGATSIDYFFIGDEKGPIRVRTTGRLFLGLNDDYLADNSGSFRVVVYY